MPNTLSPTLNFETLAPILSTIPEKTVPNIGFLGFEKPKTMRIITFIIPLTSRLLTLTSPEFTAVAIILTSISFSLGVGLGTSLIFNTSGEPYPVQITAFIMVFFGLLNYPIFFLLSEMFDNSLCLFLLGMFRSTLATIVFAATR